MLVEFIGCTGAGKSTLAALVVEGLTVRGVPAMSLEEALFRRYGLRARGINSRLVRSLLADILALPWFWLACVRHRRLSAFVFRVARQHVRERLYRLNVYRNMAKRMGAYELVRCGREYRHAVVVADEGVVHQADNLFALDRNGINTGQVDAFLALALLPDTLVLVEGAYPDLVARCRAAGHRSLPRSTRLEIKAYVGRAQQLARQLAAPGRNVRTIIVSNACRGAEALAQAADKIVDQLVPAGEAVVGC